LVQIKPNLRTVDRNHASSPCCTLER
jgi:hypothetical protein